MEIILESLMETVSQKKYFTNCIEKVRDIACEEASDDFSHSGFRTDNESINEKEMSTF